MDNSNELLIKYQVATTNREKADSQEKLLQASLEEATGNIEDWNGAKILLELLKNFKLEKRKEFILSVVNNALQDIFQSDYRLDILPRDTKGKSAASTQKYDIIFYQNGIEIARNNELLASNGGGVLSIASLFFKILIGYLYSKNKFYIFDEALSQVSPQYRTRLSLFLKEFCKRYDFTLVIVSQTEELEEHADLVYEVSSSVGENKVPILNIDEIHGDIPQKNFFYTDIKNFQSIIEAEFRFKGFTIIRGPNNSGKSASLRAIEAILFNNFKTETYPRKNPGGKKLTTEIAFGFYKDAENIKEIGLKYKSSKVMFVIEGEEYFGKSLAADKVKEAVEEIGFKYIDVKSMYKNFKGDLKEQTERIAYTNQYDGLFLIGAKTSDSEKIFSFLFNTENIALAVAQCKEQLVAFQKTFKDIQQAQMENQENIRVLKLQIDLYLKQYYLAIVSEWREIDTFVDLHSQSVEKGKQLASLYTNYIQIVMDTSGYLSTLTSVLNTSNKIEHNNKDINLLELALNTNIWLVEITGYLKLLNDDTLSKKRLEVQQELFQSYSGIIQLSEYWALIDTGVSLDNSKKLLYNKREELSKDFKMKTCDHCDGTGVIHY